MRIWKTLPFIILGTLGSLSLASTPAIAGEEFHPPQPYVIATLRQQILSACPKREWHCMEEEFFKMVPTYGPRGPIETFKVMQANGEISPYIDAHHFVHHVGHHTAMSFGSTSQAFALCPTDFHYGCFHGFFQHALGMGGTTEEKAIHICNDLQLNPALTTETKFSCFHGLGHGIMMFEDWQLKDALDVCDTITIPTGREGCWQGVFMENINVATEGKWQKGGFSMADPLAPCDKLDPKYQHECFINHNGWLMRIFQRDITKATQACLKAPENMVDSCLSSIGLSITNASWQVGYMPGNEKMTVGQKAWALCQQFPEGHRNSCVVPGVDNLMLTNNMDIKTAEDFCQQVEPSLKNGCFRQIGMQLRYIIPDTEKAKAGCQSLKRKGRAACLEGIGPVKL